MIMTASELRNNHSLIKNDENHDLKSNLSNFSEVNVVVSQLRLDLFAHNIHGALGCPL